MTKIEVISDYGVLAELVEAEGGYAWHQFVDDGTYDPVPGLIHALEEAENRWGGQGGESAYDGFAIRVGGQIFDLAAMETASDLEAIREAAPDVRWD